MPAQIKLWLLSDRRTGGASRHRRSAA